jgi:lysyl-tRNA synthetase class 2
MSQNISFDINNEEQQRLRKLNIFRENNIEPYPSVSQKYTTVVYFLKNYKPWVKSRKAIKMAGRIRTLRLQGGSCFLQFSDHTGDLQAFVRKDNIGQDSYQLFKDAIDAGDIVEFSGSAFITKTKEPTILVKKFSLLSKALLPIPDAYYGLKDPDIRFRRRYLDLLSNPNTKKIFLLRSEVIKFARRYFEDAGFSEVDTPILQSIAGGAAATPFVTHHNSLDIDLYLRVAPELYLKRLIIGGYDKVFEVARCFRNEGIDHQHNPEFTQIEAYWSYQDYKGLMKWMETLYSKMVKTINKGYVITNGQDKINFKAPFKVLDFRQALEKEMKIDLEKTTTEALIDLGKKAGLSMDKQWGRGKVLDELYKKFVRKNIIQPTFIIHHPLELSPLAKRLPANPKYVERFQLVVKGAELCNAFSELSDPLDQESRFKEQKSLKDKGDDEAFEADAEFVEALKYALPPTAGLGMGIDRLVMILGDVENIKEVIMFPTMRPKKD